MSASLSCGMAMISSEARCPGQPQGFEERHDIDAARLEDRPLGEREFVQLQLFQPLGDTDAGAGRNEALTR